MTTHAAINELARRQHGVFSRAQALSAGVTDAWLRHALVSNALRPVGRGAYAVASAPATWIQEVMSFCLAAGVYASHRTAAALFEMPRCEKTHLEFSTSRNVRASRDSAIIHRVPTLDGADTTTQTSIPTTTATRTLLDLASVVDMETLEIALDNALRRGLTSLTYLEKRLEVVERQKKVRGNLIRSLIAVRQTQRVPESPLETLALRALRRGGLPAPEPQYSIVSQGKFVARVDLAYPCVRVAIEIDGYAFHSGRESWERDRLRRNALEEAEWRVVYVTARQLRDPQPAWVGLVRRPT